MTRTLKAIIKIGDKATNFIITKNKRIILWDSIREGKDLVVSDVSFCLRIKSTYAEELIKGKGRCLSEIVENREDQMLAEVIEARVEQIFQQIKNQLTSQGLLQNVSCFFIAKDDSYITDMDKLLSKITGLDVEVVDIETVAINIKKNSTLTNIVETYL